MEVNDYIFIHIFHTCMYSVEIYKIFKMIINVRENCI